MSLNHIMFAHPDQVSVEVNSDGYVLSHGEYQATFDEDLSFLFSSDPFQFGDEFRVDGVCEASDLQESIVGAVQSDEFDKYLGPNPPINPMPDIYQDLLLINNNLPAFSNDKNKIIQQTKKAISLSSSVGIGLPPRSLNISRKIEIMADLELNYRPRYKSDYFSQFGRNRKPRYVCDRNKNHYIRLKVPVGISGAIRVDWVTIPDENGDRYVMPYKFQVDNDSIDEPDVNPIHQEILDNNSGVIKLYLVLIKAKQDALKSLQPLRPYHPMRDIFGVTDKHIPEKNAILAPKTLIEKYQLTKSQLVFTLCTLAKDGKEYIPEWNTMVYSTVLEEISKDRTAEKTAANPKCPCDATVNNDDAMIQQITINKRKSPEIKATKSKKTKKQCTLMDTIYTVN